MKQYFTLQYFKSQRLLLLAFLLVHIVIASIHISHESLTDDEPDYYTYAARWAHGHVERIDKMYDSKSPVVVVALIPRIIKQIINPQYKASDNGWHDVETGRYFMVVFTIIIAIYFFTWTRKLFGPGAWIIPMLFFLFDPLVISFSMIVTSDMASGACLIATMYHLFIFWETKKIKQFIIFSLWLGLSFVCKASLLFLLPCFLVLYILLLITGNLKFNFKKCVVHAALMLLISLAVINVAYFFKHSFTPLNEMHFQSNAFQSAASNPLINKIPIPLPANYVIAQDMLQYHQQIGAGKPESTYPGVFLNGETRYNRGFWYYYLFVGFYKIPVATLLLIIAGLITCCIRLRQKVFFTSYIWFVLPALLFFAVLSFLNPFQLGLRHLLLIYPLIFLCIAAIFFYYKRFYNYILLLGAGLFFYMLISISQYNDLIAYTNEFLTDKKNVFRKIKDGSIDYGQNKKRLQSYLTLHPGTKIPSDKPAPGKYIVRMMELFEEKDTSVNTKTWLLHFTPVAHYDYSMFIFNITEQNILELQQKSR